MEFTAAPVDSGSAVSATSVVVFVFDRVARVVGGAVVSGAFFPFDFPLAMVEGQRRVGFRFPPALVGFL